MTQEVTNFKRQRGSSWRFLKIALYLATLAGLALFVLNNVEQFKVLFALPPEKICIIMLLSSMPPFVNSFRFRQVIRLFGGNLQFKEWFGLTMCNTFYNYIFPGQAGLILRAAYLKKMHQFAYSKYIGLVGLNYLINFFMAACLAIPLTGFLLLSGSPQPAFISKTFVLSCGLLVLVVAGTIFLKKRLPERPEGRSRVTLCLTELLAVLRDSPGKLMTVGLLQVLFVILATGRIFYMFTIFGVDAQFYQVLLIQILINLTLLVSITPGNIGISEGIMAFLLAGLGQDMETVFAAMVADRAAVLLFFSVLGSVFSKKLLFQAETS